MTEVKDIEEHADAMEERCNLDGSEDQPDYVNKNDVLMLRRAASELVGVKLEISKLHQLNERLDRLAGLGVEGVKAARHHIKQFTDEPEKRLHQFDTEMQQLGRELTDDGQGLKMVTVMNRNLKNVNVMLRHNMGELIRAVDKVAKPGSNYASPGHLRQLAADCSRLTSHTNISLSELGIDLNPSQEERQASDMITDEEIASEELGFEIADAVELVQLMHEASEIVLECALPSEKMRDRFNELLQSLVGGGASLKINPEHHHATKH